MIQLRPIIFVAATTIVLHTSAEMASAACNDVPQGCKLSAVASFSYTNVENDDKDKIQFKMTKGQETPVADFGNPASDTTYDLCVYDNSELAASFDIRADGDCAAGGCWELKDGKGARYKDKTGSEAGITGIKLGTKPGEDKTTVLVKGKGVNLSDIVLPLSSPRLIVQLQNSLGQCWGAYFAPEEVANDEEKGTVKASTELRDFPVCGDGIKNGLESDIDCGLGCSPCAFEDNCNVNEDCISGDCDVTCQPGCNDSTTNGDETGIDCGGSCGATCPFGFGCNDNADCSTGLCRGTACSGKLVFATSSMHDGNLGGLSGADAICNARGTAARPGTSWTAWLSTNAVAAIDRIIDQEYWVSSGLRLFTGKDQITNTGMPSTAVSTNELGQDAFGLRWTGTNNDGTANSSRCSEWTTTEAFGVIGDNTPAFWSAAGSLDCVGAYRLICFEN
ncbi:MAG TPA: DUF1554 domain-containing protein [Candidatus Binatia bacterium]|nr:DUF1554 domain-containing protein [Candidatus Binatia bacterium]